MQIINKNVSFNYDIIDTYEAGIVLNGNEVKSVKDGKCSFGNSFISIKDNRVILKNFEIQKYQNHEYIKHDVKRDRYLLLHKNQINKLRSALNQKGVTIVPTKIYVKKNLIKIEIAIVKGKKQYDKRKNIKEKEIKRKIDRIIKNYKY